MPKFHCLFRMDTADPFMSLMQDYVPGFKASINPLVMEVTFACGSTFALNIHGIFICIIIRFIIIIYIIYIYICNT